MQKYQTKFISDVKEGSCTQKSLRVAKSVDRSTRFKRISFRYSASSHSSTRFLEMLCRPGKVSYESEPLSQNV